MSTGRLTYIQIFSLCTSVLSLSWGATRQVLHVHCSHTFQFSLGHTWFKDPKTSQTQIPMSQLCYSISGLECFLWLWPNWSSLLVWLVSSDLTPSLLSSSYSWWISLLCQYFARKGGHHNLTLRIFLSWNLIRVGKTTAKQLKKKRGRKSSSCSLRPFVPSGFLV